MSEPASSNSTDRQESATASSVYVVVFANYNPPEVDSLWSSRERAQERCSELSGMWEVQEWDVKT